MLHDAAETPVAHLLLAHGAGAPMDHAWMNALAARMVARSISVSRFEFPFMAARRDTGKARPAPRADKLMPDYRDAVARLIGERAAGPLRDRPSSNGPSCDRLPLFVAGKSLGGRVASLVAPEHYAAGQISGVICFGYPFHPPKKPATLRTAHLERFDCPALIIQGTRDPLGSHEEVATYALDPRIKLLWLDDGDHDLKPRKRSGHSFDAHLDTAADATAAFIAQLSRG